MSLFCWNYRKLIVSKRYPSTKFLSIVNGPNLGKNIGIAGNQAISLDLATGLLDAGYSLSCYINVSPENSSPIAGYQDAAAFCEKGKIKLVRPFTYGLKEEEDKARLLPFKLDLLVVVGWQRLIPEWFLESLSIGAFGTHGSPEGLPRGRGRSLVNWSLLRNQKQIKDNLFCYNAGVDSGDIVDSYAFSINLWDNVTSLHHKDELVNELTLLTYLPQILKNNFPRKKHSTRIKPTYYPKRTPDDGVIDWNWSAFDLYNLIRGVGKPYPGAFTFEKEKRIMIWAGMPFENFPSFAKNPPGSIVKTFFDGTFLVKTKDSTVLITEYESEGWKPQKGTVFESKTNTSFDKLKEAGIIS